MPLVTCDYAPFGRGWQETFDSALCVFHEGCLPDPCGRCRPVRRTIRRRSGLGDDREWGASLFQMVLWLVLAQKRRLSVKPAADDVIHGQQVSLPARQ